MSRPVEPREAERVVQGHPAHQEQTWKHTQATQGPIQSCPLFQGISIVPMSVLKKKIK